MLKEIAASFRTNDGRLRTRIVGIYILLFAMNLGAWALALAIFWNFPAALSLSLLAYGYGLRHAVGADHLAAIDNVTRQLMQQDQRPVAAGLYSLARHSEV